MSSSKLILPPPPDFNISWHFLPGYQEAFLEAKCIFEVLGEGTRGGGKTDTLLMDFYSDVGKGYGAAWKGILFRQTYKQLTDVITKSKKWFHLVCPKAKYNSSEHYWKFPDGEILLLRQFSRDDDYWNYHGHEYPWVAWEELCNWAMPSGYLRMMSTCRSSHPEVAKIIRYRSTTNPYGPGHNWVKHRFNLPGSRGVVNWEPYDEDGRKEQPRLALFSDINENTVLLESDPEYVNRLLGSARNEAEKQAWVYGSWDIVAGGMFDDVWSPKNHVVSRFSIPDNWKIFRSFDWGSSAPFSVGWWAESDGSDVQLPNGQWRSTVRGDLFRIGEWYGWNGKPNEGLRMLATEIAKGIVEREITMGIKNRCKAGPADSAIYTVENGMCIADDMAKDVRLKDGRIYEGVKFVAADKSPGSRKTGWEMMRKMFKQSIPDGKPRELPGLFIFDNCLQFLRTVPVLPRDDKDMDDVDSSSEDHIGDETRYTVRHLSKRARSNRAVGLV